MGAGAGAAAAGCNMAAGPAGSNRSHLAVHTEAASVKGSEKVKRCNSMKSTMLSIQQHEMGFCYAIEFSIFNILFLT